MIELKNAPFSFRITFRKGGEAAIIYRRMLDKRSRETLQRIVAVSPQALAAGRGLFNAAVKDIRGNSNTVVSNGHHQSLDADWGARIACFGFVSSGLADPEKIYRAAINLQHTDGSEAAWWLGKIWNSQTSRPIRALRILVGAVGRQE